MRPCCFCVNVCSFRLQMLCLQLPNVAMRAQTTPLAGASERRQAPSPMETADMNFKLSQMPRALYFVCSHSQGVVFKCFSSYFLLSKKTALSSQEEVDERNRRPTKLCIEHHLYQRGSKSQTLALPSQSSPPQNRREPNLTEGEGMPAREDTPEAAVSSEVTGLPPPATLVEVALTPFKNYRRNGAFGSGPQVRGGRGGAGHGGRGESLGKEMPPVVKLNLSLLGFESLGPASPAPAPRGQRTLRDMMWMGGDAASGDAVDDDLDGPPKTRDGARVGGLVRNIAAEAAAAPSPVPPVLLSPNSAISPAASAPPQSEDRLKMGKGVAPQAVEGSVLVLCPRCKACLPLGEAWNEHREEHLSLPACAPMSQKRGADTSPANSPRGKRPSPRTSRASMIIPSQALPLPPSGETSDASRARKSGRIPADALGELQSTIGVRSRADDAIGRRERLSDLLRLAVTPGQASGVLKDRGLLSPNGQTRFAHLFLGTGQPRAALDEYL